MTCRCRVSASALAVLIVGTDLPLVPFELQQEVGSGPVPGQAGAIQSVPYAADTPPPRF